MAADPLTNSAIDDIFNTDLSDFDDPFADRPAATATRDDKAVLSPRSSLKRKVDNGDKENDGLGLDEEVKIVKKRKPVVKLDDARLLSEPGIPKLRTLTRSGQLSKKLRIKGKGHEFTDAARLLNHFQLWLDNLYPRAKFADALQLVEKAGHSKRMQIMRNEWISEGKPGYRRYEEVSEDVEPSVEPDLFATTQQPKANGIPERSTDGQQSFSLVDNGLDDDALFIPDANRPLHPDEEEGPDDDELDALLTAQDRPADIPTHANNRQQQEDSEGEDDIDALLAEQDSRQHRPSAPTQPMTQADEDDDLDALLAEHEAKETTPKSTLSTGRESRLPTQRNDDFVQEDEDDEDELEALLAQQRTTSKPAPESEEPSLPTPQHTSSPARSSNDTPRATTENISLDLDDPIAAAAPPIFSSSPVPNNPEDVDLDDLDALLASQEEKMNARLQQEQEEEQGPSTPKARKFGGTADVDEEQEEEEDFLGSPIPNEESQ